MNFALNLAFQGYLVAFGNYLSYQKQVTYSLILTTIIMGLIPVATILIPDFFGFAVLCGLILLQGFANSIFQSNCYGLCGFLPLKFIIGVSTGNGVAGISMGLIRYVILLAYGSAQGRDIIVAGSLWFFGIVVLILTCGIFSLPVLFRHPYFRVKFSKSGEVSAEELKEAIEQLGSEEEEQLNSGEDVFICLFKKKVRKNRS